MAKITKSGSRKGSRKKMHVKKRKSQHNRRKKIRGGAPGADSNKDFKPIGGIMYWIKNTIATKVSYILNSQVTRRVEDYFREEVRNRMSQDDIDGLLLFLKEACGMSEPPVWLEPQSE